MARSFNGTSDKLQYSGAVISAMPLTIACWFLPNNALANELVSISDGTLTNIWELRLVSSKVQANVGSIAASSSTTYTTGAWHHGAAVFASSSSRAAYLDGGNKGTNASGGTNAGVNLTQIGVGPSSKFFNGSLAEIAIWNVVLTDAEIAALATGVRPNRVRGANIVAYWPLFGLNSPDIDYSGNKQNLTVTGTTQANHAPVTLWTPKRINAPVIEVASGGSFVQRRTLIGLGTRTGSRKVA